MVKTGVAHRDAAQFVLDERQPPAIHGRHVRRRTLNDN
jgi:hypothetical protein